MDFKQDPLWRRIDAYEPDDAAAAHPFSHKLCDEQRWSIDYTRRAIAEYKRFIYLCCTSPTGASPSNAVDEVWHLHLTYTIEYWNHFCKDVLQKDIHHFPSGGGTAEQQKHEGWYGKTLQLYRDTFGEEPPYDVWPRRAVVATGTPLTVEPNYFFEAGGWRSYAILLVPFLVIGCFTGQWNPYQLEGPEFLLFFVLLAISCIGTLLMAGAGKSRLLKQLINDSARDAGKYELAFIAGGSLRVSMLLVSELIAAGALIEQDRRRYMIDRGALGNIDSPMVPSLTQYEEATILPARLMAMANAIAGTRYGRRYAGLRQEYEKGTNNIIVMSVVAAIGVARVMQGMLNERPVAYLILLLFFFLSICAAILRASGFHASMQRLLQRSPVAGEQLDDLSRGIVYNGAGAITGIAMFSVLNTTVTTAGRRGSSGGSCSGSSCSGSSCSGSSCGSSCGGGCGGCGGS